MNNSVCHHLCSFVCRKRQSWLFVYSEGQVVVSNSVKVKFAVWFTAEGKFCCLIYHALQSLLFDIDIPRIANVLFHLPRRANLLFDLPRRANLLFHLPRRANLLFCLPPWRAKFCCLIYPGGQVYCSFIKEGKFAVSFTMLFHLPIPWRANFLFHLPWRASFLFRELQKTMSSCKVQNSDDRSMCFSQSQVAMH